MIGIPPFVAKNGPSMPARQYRGPAALGEV
jgi:hypothetical protein